MDVQIPIVAAATVAGVAVGALGMRAALAGKLARLHEADRARQQAADLVHDNVELRMRVTELQTELRKEQEATDGKIALLAESRRQLDESFKALSAEALRHNNEAFLRLAKTEIEKSSERARGDIEERRKAIEGLVKPVRESLEKVDGHLRSVEGQRMRAYGELSEQVKQMLETGQRLNAETGNLAKALRSPVVRGQWGEMHLRRVVEMAGMVNRCDFFEQHTMHDDDGSRLRPDMVVRLAGGRSIVVDAKTPLAAYLDAVEAPDDAGRLAAMQNHARQVRTHMQQLSAKTYWEQLQPSPEFVVMFMPGEHFLSAALEQDPTLFEDGARRKVFLATPNNLIPLLHTVAFGWKEAALAENAQKISETGRDLYKRIGVLADHWTKLGKHLGNAVSSYNQSVASLEKRVLTGARKFQELEAAPADVDITSPATIEARPADLTAPELQPDDLPAIDASRLVRVGD